MVLYTVLYIQIVHIVFTCSKFIKYIFDKIISSNVNRAGSGLYCAAPRFVYFHISNAPH